MDGETRCAGKESADGNDVGKTGRERLEIRSGKCEEHFVVFAAEKCVPIHIFHEFIGDLSGMGIDRQGRGVNLSPKPISLEHHLKILVDPVSNWCEKHRSQGQLTQGRNEVDPGLGCELSLHDMAILIQLGLENVGRRPGCAFLAGMLQPHALFTKQDAQTRKRRTQITRDADEQVLRGAG